MKSLKNIFPSIIVIGLTLSMASAIMAAPGGVPGRPDNPGPPAEESANNLSFPAVSASVPAVQERWAPETPVRGETYSYGCDKPEPMDQFSYPNTSCVDDLAAPTVFLTAEQCTAPGAPCDGLPVDLIYWQKTPENDWWAKSDLETPVTAAYLDWGDALEAVSWNERSVIRVETQPYGSLLMQMDPPFDPVPPPEGLGETCANAAASLGLDRDATCKIGFQMWHVSGQGTTEKWGARVDQTTLYPHAYESPFRIIHTSSARLNLAKLVAETATCPEPGGNANDPPPDVTYAWTDEGGWNGACEWLDEPYSSEISVTGKYVYGYNWRMKNVELDSMCSGWDKTGYWRLTFYTRNDAVVFDPENPVLATTAPPAVPTDPGLFLPIAALSAEEEEEETDALYIPEIDYTNNLTYIDICIKPKSQGGGRR